jgi:cytochrome c
MSTSNARNLAAVIASLLLSFSPPGHAESPALGAKPAADAMPDVSILPDGQGLPPGSGNAQVGSRLYQQHCLACHGPRGQGGLNDALSGGQNSLRQERPLKTVGSYWPYATTVFAYIRKAMPYSTPGILSDSDVYALTAYVLFENGIISETTVLDAESLGKVEMPNRDGFISEYH